MNDSPHVIDVTAADFDIHVIETSQRVPVLMDFWAEWCAPCRMLGPLLETLAQEYAGRFILAKVDTDAEQALAGRFRVRGLPTVMVFRRGEVVDECIGMQPEVMLRALIERHLERPSDRLRTRARAALESGAAAHAVELLREAKDLDPERYGIDIELASALLRAGKLNAAHALYAGLPADFGASAEAKRLAAEIKLTEWAQAAPARDILQAYLIATPDDLSARLQLAAQQALDGTHEAALKGFYELMQRDRHFRDDAGRHGLLAVFELLGGGELVTQYRAKMLRLLY